MFLAFPMLLLPSKFVCWYFVSKIYSSDSTIQHQADILTKTASCNTEIIFLSDNDQARAHHFVCEARIVFPMYELINLSIMNLVSCFSLSVLSSYAILCVCVFVCVYISIYSSACSMSCLKAVVFDLGSYSHLSFQVLFKVWFVWGNKKFVSALSHPWNHGLQFFTRCWRKVYFFRRLAASGWLSVWAGISSQAVLQVVARTKDFCRRSILGGRAVPFLQKVCAVHACSRCGPISLFFILACCTALREQERVCLWLTLSAAFWEMRDGVLSLLADSHIAWEFLVLCANALICYCIKGMDIIFFSFSSAPTVLFQKGTGPAFKIDNVSTYCQGRIETGILIWQRHLFLTFREAPKSERRSGLTHSFHQLFLLLSYLTAETWVSAIWCVTCFTSNKM